MLNTLLMIGGYFGLFCVADNLLTTYTRLQGIYYLVHAIHNALIVRATYPDVLNVLFGGSVMLQETNMYALQLVFALHFYHMFVYWRKFRYDDWLHHILMIGIALPIGGYLPSGPLLGYSLFFTTGLPGGIDYALLFLVRNGWLDRMTEKRLNAWINVWIRSPGCVTCAGFIIRQITLATSPFTIMWWAGITTAVLNYWNGQYFMRQVVENVAVNDRAN